LYYFQDSSLILIEFSLFLFCQLFFQILTKSFLIAAFDGWQEIWNFLRMTTNWIILSLDFDFYCSWKFWGVGNGLWTDELD
jgi:hypothetical protein